MPGKSETVGTCDLNYEGVYERRPLGWFVGRRVKIAFPCPHGAVASAEHMWVDVTGVEGDHLVGELTSVPVLVRKIKRGDRVALDRTQVEVVKLSRADWLAELTELRKGDEFAVLRSQAANPPLRIKALQAQGFTPLGALCLWKELVSSISTSSARRPV